jgi:DNA/RNA-binding domain of Phe-tRNA-synthetase-like protein
MHTLPEIEILSSWKAAFPGAHIGLLRVSGVDNQLRATPLDDYKRQVEDRLRNQYRGYDRSALLQTPVLRAYRDYYKKFGKTYHVLLQLESLLKGKSLAVVNPLVGACFTAELETQLLTASHDAARLEWPAIIDAAKGDEEIIQLNGAVKEIPAGDMIMRDARSVVCSVIYGPDQRTAITEATTDALYVTYVPPGIPAETVDAHQEAIKDNLLRFAPQARVEYQLVHSA